MTAFFSKIITATVGLNKLQFDLHTRYLTSADGRGSTFVELVGSDVDIKMCKICSRIIHQRRPMLNPSPPCMIAVRTKFLL